MDELINALRRYQPQDGYPWLFAGGFASDGHNGMCRSLCQDWSGGSGGGTGGGPEPPGGWAGGE